jgi:transposase
LNAWLVFLDESGFLMAPLVRRSWSPCGQTPLLYQRGRAHQKVSAIAALCVPPERDRVQMFFRLHPNQNIGACEVIGFLSHLDQELDGPWCLVWDRLNTHRARTTTEFLLNLKHVRTFWLPPYAPELNPVEYAWCNWKTNPLANFPLAETWELAEIARRAGFSVQRRPGLLRSFIQHSPLFLPIMGH